MWNFKLHEGSFPALAAGYRGGQLGGPGLGGDRRGGHSHPVRPNYNNNNNHHHHNYNNYYHNNNSTTASKER